MEPGRYQEVEFIGTTAKWQSYFRDTTPAGFAFLEFRTGGIVATQEGDAAEATVILPAIPAVVDAANTASATAGLVALRFYEFAPSLGDTAPNGSEVLLHEFQGEVTGGSSDLYTITLQLGSSLASVGASVPPRRFSAALIGAPCRL